MKRAIAPLLLVVGRADRKPDQEEGGRGGQRSDREPAQGHGQGRAKARGRRQSPAKQLTAEEWCGSITRASSKPLEEPQFGKWVSV